MKASRIFEIFEEKRGKGSRLFTKNLVPGKNVYGEDLVTRDGVEYREWDPGRSKLAAAIMKGAQNIGIRKGYVILYLGASTGTTVSHVSDMIGKDGFIFAIEFAPKVGRRLVYLAEERPNIAPILADANQPNQYKDRITKADIVFMDIAQRNQSEIFLKNCREFLKKDGYGLLAVKAKSIDIAKKPKKIFEEVRKDIEKEMIVIDQRNLDPFEKDHCMIICKKKK